MKRFHQKRITPIGLFLIFFLVLEIVTILDRMIMGSTCFLILFQKKDIGFQ